MAENSGENAPLHCGVSAWRVASREEQRNGIIVSAARQHRQRRRRENGVIV